MYERTEKVRELLDNIDRGIDIRVAGIYNQILDIIKDLELNTIPKRNTRKYRDEEIKWIQKHAIGEFKWERVAKEFEFMFNKRIPESTIYDMKKGKTKPMEENAWNKYFKPRLKPKMREDGLKEILPVQGVFIVEQEEPIQEIEIVDVKKDITGKEILDVTLRDKEKAQEYEKDGVEVVWLKTLPRQKRKA
jgi:hypothetical protein